MYGIGTSVYINYILYYFYFILFYLIISKKICTNSFTPDTIENDIITLGQMFLKTFHTIFDFGNKRIGFSSNLNDV